MENLIYSRKDTISSGPLQNLSIALDDKKSFEAEAWSIVDWGGERSHIHNHSFAGCLRAQSSLPSPVFDIYMKPDHQLFRIISMLMIFDCIFQYWGCVGEAIDVLTQCQEAVQVQRAEHTFQLSPNKTEWLCLFVPPPRGQGHFHYWSWMGLYFPFHTGA